MILALNHIQKSFLEDDVIRDATFHVEAHEKAALIGINGAGKSTLFKIISGELSCDSGSVVFEKGASFGYLKQHEDLSSDATVYEEVIRTRENVFLIEAQMRQLEADMSCASGDELTFLIERHARLQEDFEKENGYAIESEAIGVLKGLGFSENDFQTPVQTLSGGEKTRVALARLLMIRPDLLLLDEPTNHLDIHALSWLETYLRTYPGAVLIISHDRYFIDRTVTKIIELSQGRTAVYTGNYSDFVKKRDLVFAARMKEYENQQREIRHQEEVIETLRSFNREKSIKRAQSREKMLDKIERIEKPVEENASMRLSFTPNILSGNDVLSIHDLKKGFDSKLLFENMNCEIKRGEHIAVIGDNGTGKSTFLKMLVGDLKPDFGRIIFGTNVCIGYYDQEHQLLTDHKTVFDEIHDDHPMMTNTEVRNFLAAFLFTEDDVFKQIRDLSGGEKARVSLARLMLSDCNMLILDEPTNHLDMVSREILEQTISAYEGTVITVSHDRYYINATATRILELYHGQFISYEGNYDYYQEKKDAFHERFSPEKAEEKEKVSASFEDRKRKKEEDALRRKKEHNIRDLENKITETENALSETDALLAAPENACNSDRLNTLYRQRKDIEDTLNRLLSDWEELLSE